MVSTDRFFENGLYLQQGVQEAVEEGCALALSVVSSDELDRLQTEASLYHQSDFKQLGDPAIEEANSFARELAKRVMMTRFRKGYESLYRWLPNEIGYHHCDFEEPYFELNGDDRDDYKLLRSFVILEGSGEMSIYETFGEEGPYEHQEMAEYEISSGDIVFVATHGLQRAASHTKEVIDVKSSPFYMLELRQK